MRNLWERTICGEKRNCNPDFGLAQISFGRVDWQHVTGLITAVNKMSSNVCYTRFAINHPKIRTNRIFCVFHTITPFEESYHIGNSQSHGKNLKESYDKANTAKHS